MMKKLEKNRKSSLQESATFFINAPSSKCKLGCKRGVIHCALLKNELGHS